MARPALFTTAAVVLVASVAGTSCYGPGERNQGAYGYPPVEYKPCCDGKPSVVVDGEWGRFCPGGVQGCYKPGERNQGEEGYPPVEYKPCCDGQGAVTVYGEWGKFCPGASATPPPEPACATPGERNQGAYGYPPVDYKPCCDGKQNVEIKGEWGRFCPGGDPIPDTNCYKPGERNQGEDGYPPVDYKPCCDGSQAVKKYGDWGFFCPVADPKPPTTAAPPTTPFVCPPRDVPCRPCFIENPVSCVCERTSDANCEPCDGANGRTGDQICEAANLPNSFKCCPRTSNCKKTIIPGRSSSGPDAAFELICSDNCGSCLSKNAELCTLGSPISLVGDDDVATDDVIGTCPDITK